MNGKMFAIVSVDEGRLSITLKLPVSHEAALLFPFAATLEVKNASLAIYNRDTGATSNELVQRFVQSGAFTETAIPVRLEKPSA